MLNLNKTRKIKNFLINPKYQLKYMLWVSATGTTLITLNASIFYYFIRENYKILIDLSPMEDDIKAQLYQELYQVLLP